MNLQDLVPPLELCKLIPKGEFEDSALVWAEIKKENEVKSYIYTADMVNYYATSFHKLYPAPTLQEILEKLPGDFEFSHCYEGVPTEKYITIIGTEIGEVGNTAVESAMLTWLKLKGIKK